jgi:hypothetical protein
MNRQRFQKLAGLLNEDISYKEALRDVDAIKTIVNGKRGVAFVTERGTGPEDWKVVQALIRDNGLKAMHVEGNENNAFVVYAQGHEKDATELKDIAEKYDGYLSYRATEEDSRRIGQLLKYKPEEIEDYIIHNRKQRMNEIVVKPTLDKNHFNRYIVKSGNDFYIDAFDIDTGEEIVKPGQIIRFKYGIKWYTGTVAQEMWHDDVYKVKLVSTDELDEIVVKPTNPLSWESFKKACEKQLNSLLDMNDKHDIVEPGDRGMHDEFMGEFKNGYEVLDWYINTCKDYYDDDFEDMLDSWGYEDVETLAKECIHLGGMEGVNVILEITGDHFFIVDSIEWEEDEEDDDEEEDDELDEIVVKPTDPSKKLKDDLVKAMYDDCMDAFDGNYRDWLENGFANVDTPEVEEAMEALEERIGITKATDFYHEEAPRIVKRLIKSGNLDEIIVKPTQKPGGVYIDGREVNTSSIDVDGIDPSDYPDYSDAYASYAEFEDGEALTDEQLETLNDEYYDIVYDMIWDMLHEIVVKPAKGPKYRVGEVVKVKGIHQNNIFTVTQVYESGNDCYTHKPITMYLVGYNTTKKGKTDYTSRIPPEIIDQYWYSIEPTMENTLAAGEFNVPEEYLEKVPSVSRDARLNEIVVKPHNLNTWEGFKKLCANRMAQFINLRDEYSIWEIGSMGTQDIMGYSDGYGALNHYITACQEEYRSVDELIQYFEDSIGRDYTTKSLVDDLIYTTGLNDFLQLDLNEHEALWLKPRLNEIIVKSSKKDQNYWESEDDFPKDLNIDWDWADCEYDDDTDEDGNPVFFGSVRGTDQYRDMYEADWGGPYEEPSENKLYHIKRIGNLEDLNEIVVKPVVGRTSWKYEKDLPESIKITWDYDTMTIDDVHTPSNEAEGWIEGYDEAGTHYAGIWYGWVQYNDPNEVEGISYIGDISKLRDESMKEIVVKSTKVPIRYGNLYTLEPDDFPQQDMTWKEAHDYLEKLGPDWRLPTLAEIVYINKQKGLPRTLQYYWTTDLYKKSRKGPDSAKAVPLLGGEHPEQSFNTPARQHSMSFGYSGSDWEDKYKVCPIKTVKPDKLAEILGIDEIVVKPTSQPVRYGNLYALKPENLPKAMKRPEFESYLEKLGPGWRIPTFDELYDIYSKGGLPRDWHFFLTTNTHVFKNGHVDPEVRSAYHLGGTPGKEKQSDVFSSAFFDGETTKIFPVKDI